VPRPAYSANIFRAASFTGSASRVYVVPPGLRCVIKCISIVYGIVTLSGVDAWLQTADLCKLVRYTWTTSMTGVAVNEGGCAVYWGMWVLEPGEELYAQTALGTVDIQANGYLLAVP
jgi:hypothetical protein